MAAGDPFRTPSRLSSTSDHTRLSAIVVAISAVAWLAMILSHSSTAGSLHFSHHLPSTLTHDPLPYAQWLGGWIIMVVAMMLPPALPFLHTTSKLAGGLARGRTLVATAAAAFITAWGLVGIILIGTGHTLGHLSIAIPWLTSRPAVTSSLAAILVGAYQLSPLKRACLIACRSPIGLIMAVWNPHRPWRSVLKIGIRYGVVCIGCCWTLMLLTLIVGAFALPLMVLVSVIMLLERLLPSVRPLVPFQAAFACAIGILLLLGSLPPGLGVAGGEIPTHPTTLHDSTGHHSNSHHSRGK
jgi:predicted metal-binding membrane protein